MKKILLILVLLILLAVFAAYRNGDPAPVIQSLTASGQIKSGELKYKIYALGIIPVAEAIFKKEAMEEYQGKKVYHLSARAGNLKFLEKIVSGSAQLDSYLDIQQLHPVAFNQRIAVSGKPEILREIAYDQDQGVMSMAGVRRQIPADTQDPLSLIFNLRKADLQISQKLEFNINTNQKNYIFAGSSEPKELIVNNTSYQCAVLKADIRRRDKNNPYHRSKVIVVFLRTETENIPLLIKVLASGFPINIKLTGIE